MFLRSTTDLNYYLKRSNFIKYLDEDNISYKTKWYIRKLEKKIADRSVFNSFKYWVLWRWINKNFEFSERFSVKLKRNIKKLHLNLNYREENFINELDELLFNSWRPLKEFPVKFELEKKEKINLLQSNVNVHKILKDDKLEMQGKYDLYFSNKKIYLTNEKQKISRQFLYSDIKAVDVKRYGTIINVSEEVYLFRGKNRILTYVLLQRMIPSMKLNIEQIVNLYDYFDYWNTLLNKFN
ncbi:hypothetical protein [Spiroplasma culicicola]|uniref:Uncharacterized protein n=1 Tax=Spiroplasma culicicola AES-1 TaxID=1276246 RepID=W6A6B4_9MOLU|nr:hypothetical protein [Spiroplasma culicicola]AHI52537.1 hypothetical protein SCULI_v1c01960 [Spiroplasma culicicola AES-1]